MTVYAVFIGIEAMKFDPTALEDANQLADQFQLPRVVRAVVGAEKAWIQVEEDPHRSGKMSLR